MPTRRQLEALQYAYIAAKACERDTGLPATVTLAQWVLESGWGTHQPGNNCFGIKAYPGCYGKQPLATSEYIDGKMKSVTAEFATFHTLADCFSKHARLLTESLEYSPYWKRYLATRNVEQFVKEFAGTYATDPNYAKQLLAIARMSSVSSLLTAQQQEA